MLFAETLAVACAIHPGVLIPVFPASLLVTVLDLVYFKTDRKSFKRGVVALGAALALGNAWLVQFLIYGIPQDIGAAAPILDKLFHTDRAARDVVQSADTVVQIVSPSTLLYALFFFSLFFLLFALLRKDRQEKVSLAVIPLTALGTLFLYYAPNMGLPRFVDQSRMQSFLSFSYALAAGGFYYVFVERMCLRRLLPVRFFPASLALAFVLALAAMLLTPRWIDDPKYWRQARSMELKETPYFIYEIGDSFQPFSYTVVSNVEGFSQVYSHGYHMNPQEFLTTYAPFAKTLKIPTDYVFIFIENMPVPYQGGGQYWYRWRGDIMTKLKDWIALYGLHHRNLRLWKETRDVQVYLIDNRNAQDKKAQKLKQLRGEDR
jgi:hypothetical protein